MDITKLKNRFIKVKESIKETTEKTLEKAGKKVLESSFTIKDKESFEKLIEKSKTTFFTNKETGEKKKYIKKSILIIGEEESEFFRDIAIDFPVLSTKAFSQNIYLRLAKNKIKDVNFLLYGIEKFPAILIFQEEKVYKIISGKENIQKLVKSFKLDINKEIDLI